MKNASLNKVRLTITMRSVNGKNKSLSQLNHYFVSNIKVNHDQ